jgi:hypothetical protein
MKYKNGKKTMLSKLKNAYLNNEKYVQLIFRLCYVKMNAKLSDRPIYIYVKL